MNEPQKDDKVTINEGKQLCQEKADEEVEIITHPVAFIHNFS